MSEKMGVLLAYRTHWDMFMNRQLIAITIEKIEKEVN
jgi:hypothetical protein